MKSDTHEFTEERGIRARTIERDKEGGELREREREGRELSVEKKATPDTQINDKNIKKNVNPRTISQQFRSTQNTEGNTTHE